MNCLVTGAAGFIGSQLCERLLRDGHTVSGLDAFIPYYAPEAKQRNLSTALAHPAFRFHRLDLRTDPLDETLTGVDVIFHLAAMPGLTASWTDFDLYQSCNITATQRLLEALRRAGQATRLVVISTSSVYGRFASGDEMLPTRPISPYGVTKLASEQLCRAYAESLGFPLVILRYFSVYGPRQRPDMGYHRFMAALLEGHPIEVYGDGQQVRGNTYVDDCVEATLAAVTARPGEIYNIGGGEAASVWDILRKIEAIAGRRFEVRTRPERPGDQRHTFADTTRLRAHLGWAPRVSLDEGLARQWEWHKGGRL